MLDYRSDLCIITSFLGQWMWIVNFVSNCLNMLVVTCKYQKKNASIKILNLKLYLRTVVYKTKRNPLSTKFKHKKINMTKAYLHCDTFIAGMF